MSKTKNLSHSLEAGLVEKSYLVICRQNSLLVILLFWSLEKEDLGLFTKHWSQKNPKFQMQ